MLVRLSTVSCLGCLLRLGLFLFACIGSKLSPVLGLEAIDELMVLRTGVHPTFDAALEREDLWSRTCLFFLCPGGNVVSEPACASRTTASAGSCESKSALVELSEMV